MTATVLSMFSTLDNLATQVRTQRIPQPHPQQEGIVKEK